MLARPRGVEPLTPRSVVWCSIQLSYGRMAQKRNLLGWQQLLHRVRTGKPHRRVGAQPNIWLAEELRYRQDMGMTLPSPISAETGADDPMRRPGIALLPGRHKRVDGGHPWIYSNEVRMDTAAKALEPGALITVRRADESPLGVAMFNPHSLVA